MKIAVIATGGKQYVVSEGQKLKIEKLVVEPETEIKLNTLLTAEDDKASIGTPDLGEKVTATVVRHGRNRKVVGVRYQPKTRRSTSYGHRQHFTEILIKSIA